MISAVRSKRSLGGPVLALLLLFACTDLSAQELVVEWQPALATGGTAVGPTNHCPDGSQIVRIFPDGRERTLTEKFLAACDPDISFDGQEILFSGRRSADERLQIWRIDRNGDSVIRITNDAGDAFSPLWVGSLFHLNDEAPTQRIAYLATGHGWTDRWTGRPVAALYTSDLDGSNPWRISYQVRTALAPDVLANGRLVFPAWRGGLGENGDTRRSLMAVNNDGTDLMAFYDNHEGPRSPHSVAVGKDGRVYFVEADGVSILGGGDLAFVTLRRPLHSRTMLSASDSGAFLNPLPLLDGDLLASYRPPGRDAVYGLYRVDTTTGERLELVHRKPGFHVLDAQELVPHPKVKGRSSVVDLSKETGVFFCISSHLTDRPGLEHLRKGGASTLRVIEGVPSTNASSGRNSLPNERTLGEAPIESDGSFHIEVPAGVPLRFELFDEEGTAVARQDSWTWVMPREWRGCIGCHEDREMVAPNIMADAFVKPAVLFDRSEEVKEP